MATRSPSPTPSRPRPPDANNPLRKSKDSLKPSSVSKSSPQRSSMFEYKENEKKKPSLIPNPKVPKNFMAPTISAASKFTPSPSRRKVLQERNEVVNSVSKSLEFPIKNEFGSTNFEFGAKSEMGFVNQDISKSFEAKREDLETITHKKTSPLPQIASLDADPTLPPYDPKTNYLSPRPQFLHYKPNPRIEHYFSDINVERRSDDSFSSESSDVDYVKEKDFESESSDESFHSEIEQIKSDELELHSECENATQSSNCESESKIINLSESKHKHKSIKVRSFRRLGLISFILLIALAFTNVPLSDTPIMSSYPSMPNNYFVNMTHSVDDESATVSLSFVEDVDMKQELKESDLELLQEIVSERLHTESEMNESVNEDKVDNELEIEVIESENVKEQVEKEIFDSIYENFVKLDSRYEVQNPEIALENAKEEQVGNEETFDSMYPSVAQSSETVLEIAKEEQVENEETFDPVYRNEVQNSETVLKNAKEVQVENEETFDSIYRKEVQNSETVFGNVKEEQVENEETLDSVYLDDVKDNEIAVEYATAAGMNMAIVCGLLLSAMLAFAAAYLLLKGKGKQNVNSGSSEVSYSLDDAGRSHERRRRRDSTASSSSSFASYGSYTTYERISAKKGNREEEMVTPVRRSSRIKQLTSP